ncbi:Serine beta-lactamase-like protein LACTB, mitochondrial [Strongyloides ratti]|uniref:Serine beta-lactamase-like protein LACTB, mitochondrial n=1 Tax=Strongyloides ratti TaxID=34506 RepID=A0A090LHJ9_STRRB|nr:Serine beta-lactamase-like protein LACTB, mitochondrial [Strongyloides ratti]CEF69266.1 Serine beta-lactamase-like protein LACTB, mitochondrial [Strongyloides ratti]
MKVSRILLPSVVLPVFKHLKDDNDPVTKSDKLINHYMVKYAIPGLSITVTKNGKSIYSKGFGYSNIETDTPCTNESVFRIASISKSITAIIAGKLMDTKNFDIDKDIREYIKDFPEKTYEGEKVSITSKHLLTHMSGVRHYTKKNEENKKEDEEFLLNKEFDNVSQALELFKDDELLSKPGEKFNYTTHGFTLLSRVIEKVSDEEFPNLVQKLFNELGMNSSYIDNNKTIIHNRVQFYRRNKYHELENCPEVNNSYKIAGGGMLSTSEDLTKFGNTILKCFQDYDESNNDCRVISNDSINKIWKPYIKTHEKIVPFFYCLGWSHVPFKKCYNSKDTFYRNGYWYHTGAAVGCSSILLIKPTTTKKRKYDNNDNPKGICVAILTNVQDCYNGITNLALDIAECFN